MTDNHDACDGSISASSSTSTEPQTAAEITPTCPECESALDILHGEIVISGQNGNSAHVPVYCPSESCEWNGTATYRMIGLEAR